MPRSIKRTLKPTSFPKPLSRSGFFVNGNGNIDVESLVLGFVQDLENAGQAAKESIRESVCPPRLHRYDFPLFTDVMICEMIPYSSPPSMQRAEPRTGVHRRGV